MVALFFSTCTPSLLHGLPCVAVLLPTLSSFSLHRKEVKFPRMGRNVRHRNEWHGAWLTYGSSGGAELTKPTHERGTWLCCKAVPALPPSALVAAYRSCSCFCKHLGTMWTDFGQVRRSMFSEWCRPGWLGVLPSGESAEFTRQTWSCCFSRACAFSPTQLAALCSSSFSLPRPIRFFCGLLIPILSFHLCTKTLKKTLPSLKWLLMCV